MKGAFFAVLGFLSSMAIKIASFLVNVVLKGIATLIVFFGLYYPLFYLLYGGVLYVFFRCNLFDWSTNSQFYLLGLAECCIGAIIVSVRNVIERPIECVFDFANTAKYRMQGKDYHPEKPKVYRSSKCPDLIVYEYKDRFDLYKDYNGRISYLRTEAKKRKR